MAEEAGFTIRIEDEKCIIEGGPRDRREFLHALDSSRIAEIERKYGQPVGTLDYTFMRCSLPCGCKRVYRTPDDVPLVDVICEHGSTMLAWE